MDTNTQLIEQIFKLSRLMKEEMAYSSELLHLTMLQLQVLIFVKKHPSSQMGDIASFFKIELPSATSLINTLAKSNLIQREPDMKDKRLVRIVLTKQGTQLLADAMKIRSEKMKQKLNYLSTEDKQALLGILERLTQKMEVTHEK